MMNDVRNDTEYSCGTVESTVSNPTAADIVHESDSTILYVAGEYHILQKTLSALVLFSCVCVYHIPGIVLMEFKLDELVKSCS